MIDQTAKQTLLQAVKNGTDLETACHYAGLSTAIVYQSLEHGKLEADRRSQGDQPDTAFDDAVALWEDLRKARADAVVRNVALIQKAATNGNWQAAAWWLERSVPDQYAKTADKKRITARENKAIEE